MCVKDYHCAKGGLCSEGTQHKCVLSSQMLPSVRQIFLNITLPLRRTISLRRLDLREPENAYLEKVELMNAWILRCLRVAMVSQGLSTAHFTGTSRHDSLKHSGEMENAKVHAWSQSKMG
jgi:hypothetical protein